QIYRLALERRLTSTPASVSVFHSRKRRRLNDARERQQWLVGNPSRAPAAPSTTNTPPVSLPPTPPPPPPPPPPTRRRPSTPRLPPVPVHHPPRPSEAWLARSPPRTSRVAPVSSPTQPAPCFHRPLRASRVVADARARTTT
uniref:Uncharacterized protein n=1 Tax=Aegilops tauschii subsp. strangulata TaxID=200361 RepID=A0A453QUB7_AEGTS